MKNLFKYKPKNQIKVDGKMSEQGADKVATIMTWGKSISLVLSAAALFVSSLCGGIITIIKLL